MVYINDISFDPKHAPYQLLTLHDEHVNHVLFKSPSGIFFYSSKENKVKRAGDTPFLKGNFIEVSPNIFSDQHRTLYLQSAKAWSSKYKLGSR